MRRTEPEPQFGLSRGCPPAPPAACDGNASAPSARPLAFSAKERQQLLEVLNSERFADCSPYFVYATLLDEGRYIGSVRTLYRALEADNQSGINGLFNRRSQQIDFLKMAMDKDMPAIIRQGEGAFLEFKSTFRWDMQQSRTNRLLEGVVLKTIAGFLNSKQGGALLIGVSDNGEILGLKNDYKTLKKQNQDGFEQVIMTAIADNLGADLCAHVSILFHSITDKTICRLIVSPSARPVYIKDGNNTKFYIRTGAATRDLNIQEAVEFVQRRWESAR